MHCTVKYENVYIYCTVINYLHKFINNHKLYNNIVYTNVYK